MNDVDLKHLNHELRNALGPLAIHVEILRLQGANAETLDAMERQIARLQEIMDQMLTKP
jgi:signal transduction histidine kinase